MGIKKINITDNYQENRKETNNHLFPFRFDYEQIDDYIGGTFDYHWHPELEVSYILEGSMSYRVNDDHHRVQKGDIIFVNSHTMHSGSSIGCGDCRYFVLTFLPSFFSGSEDVMINNSFLSPLTDQRNLPYFFIRGGERENPAMASLLFKIEAAWSHPHEAYELLIQSALFELFYRLHHRIKGMADTNESGPSKSIMRMKKALDFIHTYYNRNLQLKDIAEACNLSISSCSRIFKEKMNDTPVDYLIKHRIKMSMNILRNSEMTVSETAYAVGFNNNSYFSKVFKDLLGVTPTQYKQQEFRDSSSSRMQQPI